MKIFSITLTVLFLLILFIYLLITSNRETIKNVYCLITNIITFIMSFLVTKLIIMLFGNKIVSNISSMIKQGLKITKEEWIKDSSIELVTKFLSTIVIGLLGFFILFIILYIINHLIKRLIFKINKKEAYGRYKSEKKNNKFVNILIGLGSFIIITFAFLYPIGTVFKITLDAAHNVEYNFSSNVEPLFKNPIIRLYANSGSEYFFDQVTNIEEKDIDIKNTGELRSVVTMLLSVIDMQNTNHINNNIGKIKEEFSKTYLAPIFISELCSNAATRWKNNQPFMGYSIKIPDNSSKELYMDLLDIMSKWEREDLLKDIDTIFEFYNILNKYEVLKIENTKELINALTKEEFNEEIFLCLFHNEDFKSVLASFMNYGLRSILEQFDIDVDVEYVETAKIMKMSDEDIKNEARIFALTIKQLVDISEAIGENISKEDYNKIVSNLNEIKDSELLNSSLYKLINRLLRSV